MSGGADTPLGRIRNIGIIAHIDAGKTTTTERILYYSGKEHRMGEVHDGNTVTDYLLDERERGITITSAATTLFWQDHKINLIDTPGHVDFTAEVERSLRVLDGAVAVFCGVGGVEAQSETVWRQADRYHVPRLAYINKLDRAGAEMEHVLQEMRDRLHAHPLPIQIPVGREDGLRGVVDLVRMEQLTFSEDTSGGTVLRAPIEEAILPDAEAARNHMLETLAEDDDALMEAYLAEEPISEEMVTASIRRQTLSRRLCPVLCGSSLKNKGVQPLLDAVVAYLPSPKDVPPMTGHLPDDPDTQIVCEPSRKEPLAALAFKVIEDAHGPLVFLRIYSGTLSEGERVLVAHSGRKERASRLWRMHADRRERETEVVAGDIIAVSGLKFARTGDTVCAETRRVELEPPRFPQTVISMAMEPRTNDDRDKLMDTLEKLTREDPTFHYHTDEETGQLVVSGMGELHLEIIATRITRDYNVAANTGTPRVTYREAVAGTGRGTGEVAQAMGGRNHEAAVEIVVARQEEAEPTIDFEVDPLRIPKNFHNAIREGILSACLSGPLGGYPMIHLHATVTGGRTHETDSSDLAFTMAAEAAMRHAVTAARAQLLEPIMSLEVTTPEEFLGGIIHDLNGRGAEITEIGDRGHLKVLHGRVPLSKMFGYSTVVRSLSTGRASYSMEPCAYAPVARGRYTEILGYDPER